MVAMTPIRRTNASRYIAPAESALRDVNYILNQIAHSGRRDASKLRDLGCKVADASRMLLPVLEGIATVHPAAEAVCGAFKADKHELDEQISVVHHSMSLSLFNLRMLADNEDVTLDHNLGPTLRDLEDVILAFGNFVTTMYLNNGFRAKTVRFLKASEYKKTLDSFRARFAACKRAIYDMASLHSAMKLDSLSVNISKVLGVLSQPRRQYEQANKMLEELGDVQDVIYNEAKLQRLANVFGETVTHIMGVTLRTSMETILADSLVQYEKKLHGATRRLEEVVARSRDAVLKQLNEGPHERIEDDDIRIIWQVGKWRNSVKTRVWVDGVHDYFEQHFRDYYRAEGRIHPDQWTLQFISRVIYHSALADAIDDDSSGFISVHEVNEFVRRKPSHWSLPEWLAFWAAGWTRTCDDYHEDIQDTCVDMKYLLRHQRLRNGFEYNQKNADLIKSLTLLCKMVTEDEDTDDDNSSIFDFDLGLDDPVADGELGRLVFEYRLMEEARLREGLRETVIEDIPSLVQVLGHSRIELGMLPLLHIYLEGLYNVHAPDDEKAVERAEQDEMDEPLAEGGDFPEEKTASESAPAFHVSSLYEPLEVLACAFHGRMHELMRVWRQQRLDASAQVRAFAGGIFAPWYAAAPGKRRDILEKLDEIACDGLDLSSDEDEEEDADVLEDGTYEETVTSVKLDSSAPGAVKRLRGDVDQKLQELWKHINDGMNRLENVERLMKVVASRMEGPTGSRNASGPEEQASEALEERLSEQQLNNGGEEETPDGRETAHQESQEAEDDESVGCASDAGEDEPV